MKKTYITPSIKLYLAIEENLIANSPGFYQTSTADDFVQGGEELSREDNSISSSNIWDQGW